MKRARGSGENAGKDEKWDGSNKAGAQSKKPDGSDKEFGVMESPAEKKQMDKKWVFFALAVVLLTVVFLACRRKHRETEYTIIQVIIENLSGYQDEIESWGYQVSVLPRFTEMPDDEGLVRYYYESDGPVLVLTDPEGGRYCFYYGFDQYLSEAVRQESVLVLHPEREYVDALKTVRLQIHKRDMDSAPLWENTAEPDSGEYYDMVVRLYIRADSPESGQELMTYTNGYYETNYCSNNFTDCKWFSGITPEDANRYSDDTIKQEYSASQLLGLYRQGLKLQEQLTEMYHERQREGRQE